MQLDTQLNKTALDLFAYSFLGSLFHDDLRIRSRGGRRHFLQTRSSYPAPERRTLRGLCLQPKPGCFQSHLMRSVKERFIFAKYFFTIPMQQTFSCVRFYDQKSILITGTTGFVAKVLLEKILRVLDVRCVYILIRAKKGQ